MVVATVEIERTKTAGRTHKNSEWGLTHKQDNVGYDELEVIESKVLLKQFYVQEFNLLSAIVNSSTIKIEKRRNAKNRKVYFIAILALPGSQAVWWIPNEQVYTRLKSLH